MIKRTRQIWINLRTQCSSRLSFPKQAHEYRIENLYGRPMGDEAAKATCYCEEIGSLMYASRVVPTSDKGRFYALRRVVKGAAATIGR